MSKLALIASVALHFAGRGAAADRAVAQVIKSTAVEAIARARTGGPLQKRHYRITLTPPRPALSEG